MCDDNEVTTMALDKEVILINILLPKPALVAQLDALVIRRLQVRSHPGRQNSFEEIDHEIFSTDIFSLLPIQEGQLSVSGERMCTILVNT